MKSISLKIASALSLIVAAGLSQACFSSQDTDSETSDEPTAEMENPSDNAEGETTNTEHEATGEGETNLGTAKQGLMNCANPDGTNSVMAALAVATAQELKRWQPSKDFVVFGATGGTSGTSGQCETCAGPQQAIKLTATGKARCSDGKCSKVQALLDMQYDQANNKVKLGSVILSPAALRSRLVAKLRDQITCENSPKNGTNTSCPVEEHQLTFQSSAKGSCDTNFFFKATTPTGTALKYPAQLKNKLIWVDQSNPYVAFQSVGDVVSIDPTWGLNEDSTNTAGSCDAICTKITTTNVAGKCCSCNGATKKFVKAAWNASTFLCQ
jgi:hypothetical protein